jgi:hypothetical protein
MKNHLRWGVSFQAVIAEFTTSQIEALREHCRNLIDDADQFVAMSGTRVSAIPFEKFEYGFMLERVDHRLWSLELVGFPPHAGHGVRMSAARRLREKAERLERRAMPQWRRRLRDPLQPYAGFLHNSTLSTIFGHTLRASWLMAPLATRDAERLLRSGLRRGLRQFAEVRNYVEQLLYDPLHSVKLQKRIEATSEITSGKRLERRVFNIGPVQLALNTWAPIDPGFDEIWDISLFGVRLVESERL